MGIQRGSTCHFILIRGKQVFQFRILPAPVVLTLIKGICQAAPADIPGEDFLFLRVSVPIFCLQCIKKPDGSDIALIFLLRAAFAKMGIGDTEILRWNLIENGIIRYFYRPCRFLCKFLLHLRGF